MAATMAQEKKNLRPESMTTAELCSRMTFFSVDLQFSSY
jgi:hypothetical protein